jgi:hypothetical protein
MTQTLPESAVPRGAATGDPERVSGGHLVAKALKAEGNDTIFTLGGGHNIDINVWGDPDVCAPGTMNQTMYK